MKECFGCTVTFFNKQRELVSRSCWWTGAVELSGDSSMAGEHAIYQPASDDTQAGWRRGERLASPQRTIEELVLSPGRPRQHAPTWRSEISRTAISA